MDMTGAMYLMYLPNEQEKMKQEILSFCMDRKEGVTANQIYANLNIKYPLQEGREQNNVVFKGVLRNLLMMMVSHGKLEERIFEEDVRYRVLPFDDNTKAA